VAPPPERGSAPSASGHERSAHDGELSAPPLSLSLWNRFSTKGELIASSHSVEEIRRFIGLDSLNYLSLEGLLEGETPDRAIIPFVWHVHGRVRGALQGPGPQGLLRETNSPHVMENMDAKEILDIAAGVLRIEAEGILH